MLLSTCRKSFWKLCHHVTDQNESDLFSLGPKWKDDWKVFFQKNFMFPQNVPLDTRNLILTTHWKTLAKGRKFLALYQKKVICSFSTYIRILPKTRIFLNFENFKELTRILSWKIRVHFSKKLLQQNLMANGLPVVAGCLVIMIFCFHPIRKTFLCEFLISAISLIYFIRPGKCNFEKNADFFDKKKPNYFHLMSIVKKMIRNVFFNHFLYSLKMFQWTPWRDVRQPLG